MSRQELPPRPVAPPRGTRPPNRRELLLATAADLFRDRGYGNVSMKDVAVASNISPSSLYTHFSGKPQLLHETIATQIDASFAAYDPAGSAELRDVAAQVADGVIANRALGVLWQRESRNLEAGERAALRRQMGRFSEAISAGLVAQRPGVTPEQARLLTQCALGAVTSISFHQQSLPRDEFRELVQELCLRMLTLHPADAEADRPSSSPRRQRITRRAELAEAALRLFAERGFSAVSVDDIGAAVGIAGPSVYKHVQSKQELLRVAFERGTDVLRASMDAVLESDATAEDAVREVTDAYVDLALDQADLITVVIAEANQLDAEGLQFARRVQRSYIDDWVSLLQALRPEDPVVTRMKVQAAQMVANDIGRTPGLRRVPGWRATVHSACWELQR